MCVFDIKDLRLSHNVTLFCGFPSHLYITLLLTSFFLGENIDVFEKLEIFALSRKSK